MPSAISFNWHQSKILSSGNGLKLIKAVRFLIDLHRRSLDVFEKAQTAALNSVNPDRANGEVTIRLPADCQPLLAG